MLSQTFLGPVTRLKMSGGLIADMSTARASALPVGANVVAQVPTEGVQLLTPADDEALPDIGEGIYGAQPASAAAGRSVKTPGTPRSRSSSIRAVSLTV